MEYEEVNNMTHWTRGIISTALIGTGFAVIMAAIAYQFAHDMASVILGWTFGVVAMALAVACDNYFSRRATTGGK